jgi:hypothetical protein
MADTANETDEVSKSQQIAVALVEATQDFVEALMLISETLGPDHEDDLERAIGVIKSMQRTAFDVLLQHGFEPRGELVE